MRAIRKLFVFSSLLAVSTTLLVNKAMADTILSVTGGGGLDPVVEMGNQWVGTSWTSTLAYTNVTINADLYTQTGTVTAVAYLTTNVGPSFNAATDLVASSLTAVSALGSYQLFSGLNLSAGSYFLVLGTPGSLSWVGAEPATVTTGAGVSHIGSLFCHLEPDCDFSLPPHSTFSIPTVDVHVNITGTAVPEPSTVAFGGLGLLGVAVLRTWRNRKTRLEKP